MKSTVENVTVTRNKNDEVVEVLIPHPKTHIPAHYKTTTMSMEEITERMSSEDITMKKGEAMRELFPKEKEILEKVNKEEGV